MTAQDAPAHLLIVDDDTRIRSLLQKYLLRHDYLATCARDAAQARRLLAGLSFDLIVLDVMMPGEDGISLTRHIRANLTTPVLLLTARGEAADRIEGLEAGADDYLAKPFEPRELLLRINAILRRAPQQVPEQVLPQVLTLGPLRYDLERGELKRGNQPVRLTQTEATIMRFFCQNPGEVISRETLVAHLGRDRAAHGGMVGQERAVDVQITRLRRKIEHDPKTPRHLQTVRGAGYILMPD
ncbi:MAG: response regulator [Rhodobacteraceae bacterium]|nr:MAG: response regulator [Paracoccaceae bacterium]